MAKAKKRKHTNFESAPVKSVFLYGHPNKQKVVDITAIQKLFTDLVNKNIQLLSTQDCFYVQLIKNDKKDSKVRIYEKSVRTPKVNSAFCQAAFDMAFTHLSNRLNAIKDEMYGEHSDIFTESKVLFAMALEHATPSEMIAAMEEISLKLAEKRKTENTERDFHKECVDALRAMSDEDFQFRMKEFEDSFAMFSLEYKIPFVSRAEIPLDSRLMKIKKSNNVKEPYVISFSHPTEKGKRITVPLNTSKHSIHKIETCKMAKSVACSIKDGTLRIAWSYQKSLAQPKTSEVKGVDTGILDLFYVSDGEHVGSMKEVLDFYHNKVETAFAELSKLRNKKRSISHYVRKHKNLPEDVRRSLIRKMDRLEHMIQTMDEPYRKLRHYYQMLDKTIKDAVRTYIASINRETITVIEMLDIKEFNKSRYSNGMFSRFARGKAQITLMKELNWRGYDFIEVAPDFTSQVCPVCGNRTPDNRNGKVFHCTCCGHTDDADHNASVNIKERYLDKEQMEICEKYKLKHEDLQAHLIKYYYCKNAKYKKQHPEKRTIQAA